MLEIVCKQMKVLQNYNVNILHLHLNMIFLVDHMGCLFRKTMLMVTRENCYISTFVLSCFTYHGCLGMIPEQANKALPELKKDLSAYVERSVRRSGDSVFNNQSDAG